MSFPEISSRGGLAATNSTSECVNKSLFGSFMSQDEVANLDSMVEVSVETATQERKENKRKNSKKLLGKRAIVRVDKSSGTLFNTREPLCMSKIN